MFQSRTLPRTVSSISKTSSRDTTRTSSTRTGFESNSSFASSSWKSNSYSTTRIRTRRTQRIWPRKTFKQFWLRSANWKGKKVMVTREERPKKTNERWKRSWSLKPQEEARKEDQKSDHQADRREKLPWSRRSSPSTSGAHLLPSLLLSVMMQIWKETPKSKRIATTQMIRFSLTRRTRSSTKRIKQP